jgi:hypothetical protein
VAAKAAAAAAREKSVLKASNALASVASPAVVALVA